MLFTVCYALRVVSWFVVMCFVLFGVVSCCSLLVVRYVLFVVRCSLCVACC